MTYITVIHLAYIAVNKEWNRTSFSKDHRWIHLFSSPKSVDEWVEINTIISVKNWKQYL